MGKVNHFNSEDHVFSEDVTVTIDSGNSIQLYGDIRVNGAALLNPLTTIVKSADQTIPNPGSVTLQDDIHLKIPVVANTTYEGEFIVWFVANAAADIQFDLVVPSGSTSRRQSIGTRAGDSLNSTEVSSMIVGAATGVYRRCVIQFYVEVSSTPGFITLQWAQAVLHASDCTVGKGSLVNYRKLF